MRHPLLGRAGRPGRWRWRACTPVRNPATGELQYTSLSPADERQLGAGGASQGAGPVRRRLPATQSCSAYVERVGDRVKDASELEGEPFTFTLLDSDVVNAFALPGGYVYVTRGLLALANDEAELAGVLGHEIGHVTARHTRAALRPGAARAGAGAWPAQLAGLLLGGYLGGARGCAGRRRARRAGSVAGCPGLCPGLLARAGVRGRRAGHPLSRRCRLRSRRHGELPRDAAGRRRLPPAAGQDGGDGGGELSRRLVPHPSAHARARRARGRRPPARRCRARTRPTATRCSPPSTA